MLEGYGVTLSEIGVKNGKVMEIYFLNLIGRSATQSKKHALIGR